MSDSVPSKELANCPFCGFVAREFHWRGHVGCSNVNCGAHAANITVEQWNRRPTHEPPAECPACEEFVRMQHDIASILGVDEDTDSISLHDRIYGALSSSPPPVDDEAYRLLYVVRAWFWTSAIENDPGREDPLYPDNTKSKSPLFAAISDLLKTRPYSRPTKSGEA